LARQKSARTGREQMQRTTALFGHLVGGGQQRHRRLEA
jgi:hypothetical protein